ncbi:MAG: hypothetical protein KDA41_10020 [Planctomycetales bacterium]|nr:hypothetical protein [Planctomycetales bacterium]
MAQITPTDSIRRRVRDRMRQFGAREDAEFSETLLVRNGCYCGRRFHMDGLSAVWFVEEDELKIYGPQGSLLESSAHGDPTGPQRQVA